MIANQEYINAVCNLDVDAFKTLLDKVPFDKSLLSDIKFSDGDPCPIYWITQCWEIIFCHPEEWSVDNRYIINENKLRNLEIKRLFEEKLKVVFKPIDFYNTNFWFFRNYREDTFDDVFDCKKEDMIAKGYREIDLDLYVAVNKFDYDEAKRLLELGADPECEIDEDEGTTCLRRIGTECGFLSTELQEVYIDREKRNPIANNAVDLVDLIGWAAHENMYSLLSKYKEKFTESDI